MSFVFKSSWYYPKLNEIPFKVNNKDVLSLAIKDVKALALVGEWTDGLEFGTEFSSYNTFIRQYNIGLELGTQVSKEVMKHKDVGLEFGALKLGNAGQVIGDIRFYDKVLNETNYDESFTPFGYGKWKVMITGDYIYERALCKYVMQASLNADRPNTREYLHKVDVPDTVDRGTIELTTTNQPYHVRFTPEDVRFFHIVPEVNVTIKSYSGIGSSPIIIPYDITTEGFYVTMKVDGAFVEGSITYAARGY